MYPFDEAHNSIEYCQEILNALPVGLLTFDKDFKLTFINTKAVDIFGYSNQELTGLKCDEITEILDKFPPGSITKEVAEQRRPVKNKLISIKNKFDKNTMLRVDAYQIKDDGFILSFFDASKEQELENLQLQTQNILDSINNLVILIDNQKKIIMCNNTLLESIGIEKEKVIGMDIDYFNDLIAFNKLDIHEEFVKDKIYKTSYEASVTTLRGEQKNLLVHYSLIPNVLYCEIIGAISICTDITNIKKEQYEALRQEKLASLGLMAAGIAHEIRNPLTTIKGFSQIISEKTNNEQVKEYARIIDDTANEANKVMTDFLNFAIPQRPVLKKIMLNSLLESMLLMLDSNSFLKDTNLKLDLTSELCYVNVDETQIKQVILYVVKNALEAMTETPKPKLTITSLCNKRKDKVFIRISDNGDGISQEDIKKIGTPFFTTRDRGTGLSLSVSYKIIKEHGGKIEVESKERQGTIVTIILPTANSTAAFMQEAAATKI